MIVGDKRNWLGMVFAIRGSSLRQIWPRVAVVTIFAVVVTVIDYSAENETGFDVFSLTEKPFTIIGLALAIFLGFRNNEAYDRYWEGRTLWGKLINVSRSFTRQSLFLIRQATGSHLVSDDQPKIIRERLVRWTIAYCNALRHHLRETDPTADIAPYFTEDELAYIKSHSNRPVAILQLMGADLQTAWKEGYVHDFHVPVLEGSLTDMTDVQGGCERIKNTPIPFTYNVLIHRIVAIYCLALPLGLYESAQLATPIVVCLISYAFFGLDAIGDEVEEPFERDDNDLPLEAMCRTIEINLREILGDEEVPEPLQPVEGVLL